MQVGEFRADITVTHLQALAFAEPRKGLNVPVGHALHWFSFVRPSSSKYDPAGHN